MRSCTTQTNTRRFHEAITDGFPELDEREQLRIAAVVRCLISSQAWLRMRKEFGVPVTEAGPVVAWVIDTIFREIRSGNAPPARSTSPQAAVSRPPPGALAPADRDH